MKNHKNLFNDLKKEVIEIHDSYPAINENDCFIAWFLRAFITNNEEEAIKALTGNSGDKSIDAIYVDHNSRNVFVVQGKYHILTTPNEKRSDIIALADIGRTILLENKVSFDSVINKANTAVKEELKRVRNLVQSHSYGLILQYVSTGKISKTHVEEASARVDEWDRCRYESYSRTDLLNLMQDYLEGAAPPTPSIFVPVFNNECLKKHDSGTDITTWLFTIEGKELAKIYSSIGLRLFARNIRGYQGNTKVNRGIKTTIEKEPEYFWYYNNGITIVCDEAKKITKGSSDIIKVINAQIINGQQTTRTLSEYENNKTQVLVKLIELNRNSDQGQERYKKVVSEIVSSTNWQNSIMLSDLKSNDAEQVRIEREFKKYGYFYLRKRMKKSEAYNYGARNFHYIIKKEDLSRYLAATIFDPYIIRLGKDRLFENDIYYDIFDGRHPSEYLAIYNLGYVVDYWAKSNSNYRYTKWLVFNFIWKLLKKDFKKRNIRENFRSTIENEKKYLKELKPLDDLTKLIYKLVFDFYKVNNRIDGKKQGPIDFFKHVDLHIKFAKYYDNLPGTTKKKIKTFKSNLLNNLEVIKVN